MQFNRRIKGSLTQTIVKALLEDAGYRVVPLGIEEVVREVVSLSQEEYLNLGLPNELRTLPDFLVTNKDLSESWLLEVKYRKNWSCKSPGDLEEGLRKQASIWKNFLLLMFIAEPYSGGELAGQSIPMNHCRLVKAKFENDELLYFGRYENPGPYPWKSLEWHYANKIDDIFRGLDKQLESKTIEKACDFIRQYPQILDERA